MEIIEATTYPLLRFADDEPMFERFAIMDFREYGNIIGQLRKIRINSYCFVLIESGNLELEVNGYKKIAGVATLISGIPGEIWEWGHFEKVKGRIVFFEAPFILAGLRGGYTLNLFHI